LGNILADFSYKAILTQLRNPAGYNFVIKEHPEDLGVVPSGPHKGKTPASIWQFPQHQECIEAGALSYGIRQNDFGMPYPKPTRVLLKLPGEAPSTFYHGLPSFDSSGRYAGPIPRSTTHTATLAKTSASEGFRTTGTAAWPPLLCIALATMATSPNKMSPPAVATQGDNKIWLADGDRKVSQPKCASDSFPVNKPPESYNRGGTGLPRRIFSMGRWHEFHDGGGLCSPGRFEKDQRSFPKGKRWDNLREELERIVLGDCSEVKVMKMLLSICCGKQELFDVEILTKVRTAIHLWLGRQSGDYPTEKGLVQADGQPFYLTILRFLLREGNDPDFAVMDEYETGVNLGVTSPLPHTPAVFELQEKWRLKDDILSEACWMNPNYSSLDEHKEVIKAQLIEDEAEGLMGRMSLKELKNCYKDDFAISALSALKEKDKVRLLHDGSHVTRVNHKIKCRDKQRCPGPREKAFLLNGYKDRGAIAFSALGDVGKAHRRVKVRREDWGWMACTLEDLSKREAHEIDSAEIWYNRVGTFGLSSASYWWSRLGACLIRAMYILLGPSRTLDSLLYADDLELIAENKREKISVLLGLIYLLAIGTPLKWSKFRCGFGLDWVGYYFCHRSHSIGLSETRAQWIILWIGSTLKAGSIIAGDFSAGLGRLNFAAMALIYEKPFLGILYAWSASIGHSGTLIVRIPWACRMVLYWLAKRIKEENGRLQAARTISQNPQFSVQQELFRSDAKATADGAWLGGWEFRGGQKVSEAKWWAFEVKSDVFPWLFCKKDPKRIIAALEMLATIVCIMVFGSEGSFTGCFTGGTDNQSNTFASRKLLSTKFPLTILIMELSEQLRVRNSALSLRWVPREQNQDADDLTNLNFSKFDEKHRIPLEPAKLDFLVLGELNRAAGELYKDLLKEKENKLANGPNHKNAAPKRNVTERLKWKDPW